VDLGIDERIFAMTSSLASLPTFVKAHLGDLRLMRLLMVFDLFRVELGELLEWNHS
jgi:hypothetical protein